jgi:putative ABC transport system permease protein
MAMAKALGAAVRNLRRAPAFTGLVVLTLALGIGATTAMFSVVDAVLLNPLPFPNSERFGEIWTVPEKGSRRPGGSTALLNALSRQQDLFTAVGAYQYGSANLTGSGEPELLGTPQLSPGLLAILGVRPSLGRWFTDEEAATGTVVLLSERIWRRRFGADPAIVGQTVMLDDRPHLVVGVMPNRFRYPTGTALMWRPMNTAPTAKTVPAQLITVRRPELTRAQVNERLFGLTHELRASAVIRPADTIAADDPLQARPAAQTRTALYMLFGGVGLVLLVACVNVMNLLLVRGSARSGELALMSALGASRGSLIRDVFFESLILVVAGCATGIMFARGLLAMILAAAPRQMMFLGNATSELDGRALGFGIALALATGLIFGVLPAWRATRIDAIDALKARAQTLTGSKDEWWQGALVAAQLALVVVLLAGSGLLMRSFGKLMSVDHGFDADQLAAVDVELPRNRYGTPGAALAFMQELERRVEETGLRAAVSGGSPPKGGGLWFDIKAEIDDGRIIDLGPEHLFYSPVTSDYFSVMGIPLLDGRTFDREDPPDVAIIGSVMAARFFGDSNAIGRRYRLSDRQPWTTVVGVAADVKQLGPNESGDSVM